MKTLPKTAHRLGPRDLSLSDDDDPAFVIGDLFPHEGLSGLEMELFSESSRHGNLTAFRQGCERGIHVREILSCIFIMSIFRS